jgi:hypothetical protein
MITALIAQVLFFGPELPPAGPLAPYRTCVLEVMRSASVEELQFGAVFGRLEAACGSLRRAALPQLIADAVERSRRSDRLIEPREIESYLPMMFRMMLWGAADAELRSRGLDPSPPSRAPSILRPPYDPPARGEPSNQR